VKVCNFFWGKATPLRKNPSQLEKETKMLKIALSIGLALPLLLGSAGARLSGIQSKNTQAAWQSRNPLHRNQNQTSAAQQIREPEQAKFGPSIGTQHLDPDWTQQQKNLLTKTQTTVPTATPANRFMDRDRIRRQEQLCTQVQDSLQKQHRLNQSNPTGTDRNGPYYKAPACG
jgi:hypothetical protein